MATVIDKVDKILYKNHLEFEDEERWEEAIDRLRQWVHEYYEELSHSSDTYMEESTTIEEDEEEEDENVDDELDVNL